MIEALETLKINATNGKENFCYINEKQLKALKELAKRDRKEIKRLNNIINELEKWLDEAYEYLLFTDTNKILKNSKEQMDKYGYFHDLGSINDVVNFLEKVREKLKKLKEKNND